MNTEGIRREKFQVPWYHTTLCTVYKCHSLYVSSFAALRIKKKIKITHLQISTFQMSLAGTLKRICRLTVERERESNKT